VPQIPHGNKANKQQNTAPDGQGLQYTDKDILQLCLNETKYMAIALNVFIQEAIDEQLRRDYMTLLGELYNQQKQLFDLMEQKGYYVVKPASPKDLAQVQQQFSSQPS